MKKDSFESIKDPQALQEYLQKHTASKAKVASENKLLKQNDVENYKGLDSMKNFSQ